MKRAIFFSLLSGASFFAQEAVPPIWPERPLPCISERVAVLEDTRLKECSGLCCSLRTPEVFWTLNDSGDEPCVYAVDRAGKTRAKVRLPEAVNFDWEDIASGKDENGEPQLFIGDIGDNFRLRPTIQVYQITEPAVTAVGDAVDERLSSVPKVWRASYPDGKHNAESLLVHPLTRRIYILTKSEDGRSALYAFPETLQEDQVMTLEKIAALDFPAVIRLGKRPSDNCLATAACFAPDGTRMAAATYSSLYEWELPSGMTLGQALKQPPSRLEPPLLRQLESVCYDSDSLTLWLTSEHLPTPLLRVKR